MNDTTHDTPAAPLAGHTPGPVCPELHSALLAERDRLRADVAELRGILADCRAAWVRTDDGRSLAMAHAMKRTNAALARTGTPEGGQE